MNWLVIHNNVFRKLLETGTVVELADSEQEDLAGGVHYVLMQLEEKLENKFMQ